MISIQLLNSGEVRKRIAKEGKSLRAFACDVGISHSYFSQILNGKRFPSAKVAFKISSGLKAEVEEIFLIESVAKDNPVNAGCERKVKS